MVDKFIMVDMNDDRTSKIAEIMASKTSKNILSLISESEKDLSSTDISFKLKIPLNTVDYNLKKLINAGLVEESKSFFWSVKGRKIKTFKAANKKIIISTKPKFIGVIASALLVGVIGFSVRLAGNILSVSKAVYSNNILPTVNDGLVEKVASTGINSLEPATPLAFKSTENLIAFNTINFSSLFSNTLIWFIVGALMGIVGFMLYKKLKGGKF